MSGSILLITFFVTSVGCKLCAGFRRIENSPDLHQQPNLAVTIVRWFGGYRAFVPADIGSICF